MPYVSVVDISADPDPDVVGAELDEICRTVGFFQITGHGIPDVAEPAWTMATKFFDLPLGDKLSVARPTPDYPYGYIPLAGESLSQSMTDAAPPDLKEVFNIGPPVAPAHRFADPDEAWVCSPNLWPAALPELEAMWTAYYDALRELSNRLMSLFARAGAAPRLLRRPDRPGAECASRDQLSGPVCRSAPGTVFGSARTPITAR